MNEVKTANPYQVSVHNTNVSIRTPRGYTPTQCLWRSFAVSFVFGCVGGLGVYALSRGSNTLGILLIPLGLSFALALIVSLHSLVGEIPSSRMVCLLVGCLLAFVVSDIANQSRLSDTQNGLLYAFRWYVSGPLAAAIIIVPTIRLVAGVLPQKLLLFVWALIVAGGGLTLFIYEMLSPASPSVVAGCCACLFQTIIVTLTCWVFALAKGRADESQAAV